MGQCGRVRCGDAAGAGIVPGFCWSAAVGRMLLVRFGGSAPFAADFRRFWAGLGALTWYDSFAPSQAAKWADFDCFSVWRIFGCSPGRSGGRWSADRGSGRRGSQRTTGTKKHRALRLGVWGSVGGYALRLLQCCATRSRSVSGTIGNRSTFIPAGVL